MPAGLGVFDREGVLVRFAMARPTGLVGRMLTVGERDRLLAGCRLAPPALLSPRADGGDPGFAWRGPVAGEPLFVRASVQ